MYTLVNVHTGRAVGSPLPMSLRQACERNKDLILCRYPFAYVESSRIVNGFCVHPPERELEEAQIILR